MVVTGTGVINALGYSVNELWENLLAGQSKVRAMDEWLDMPGQIAAPLKLDENKVRSIDRKRRRAMGPLAIYAALAAEEALNEAGLLNSPLLGNGRCGCAISSTTGSGSESENSIEIWRHGNREMMPAMQFFRSAPNSCAFNTANTYGITGVQLSPSAACASGMQAIGAAYECIRFGRQEVMVAGGADELTPLGNGTFEQLFALADPRIYKPEETSRPFDADRIGLVCSEGAGILILEELEHAQKRGAQILFEISGYATNCSGEHLSQSEHGAIEKCVRNALADAGVSPNEIDYISAHATGTRQGDSEEALGLAAVFGKQAPVSSLKGHIGHTLGASGAIELIACGKMMANDLLIPTLNLNKVGEDCAGISHVMQLTPRKVERILKNSFAFGGINAVIIAQKFK